MNKKQERAYYKRVGKERRELLEEILHESDESTLTADGFDAAIVGITTGTIGEPRVVYDYDECVRILVVDGMTEEEAIEHMSFNVTGSYVGEQTPIFIRLL